MRKNASILWAHFDKDNANKKAKCNVCHEILSYKSTTANLRNHIKRKHPGTYTSLAEEENQQMPTENEPSTSGQTLPSTSRNPVAQVLPLLPPKNINQKVIDNFVSKKISTEQKRKIDQDLLDLCVDGFHPFSIVEERGFKKFCHWIPGYKLPTRKTLSNSLLDETYNRVEQRVRAEVTNEVQTICITTDLWTSRARVTSRLLVTT